MDEVRPHESANEGPELGRFHGHPEEFIETREAFDRFAADVVASGDLSACSIDTEADSMHSYETKLCLIQFAVPGRLAIIDPLAIGIEGLEGFPAFIDRFESVWMHGADYDISLFQMTFDWVPRVIWDTQIAARLLGWPKFGLANLLETEYGVEVSKQSQKADWSRRPLTAKMLAYAYDDVRYLIDLGERFVQRLIDRERLPWFEESCHAARESALRREGKPFEEVWRITGWGKLSPKGLHYLRELWLWRDDECRRLDRPAFKFLSNQELLRMARLLEAGEDPDPPRYLKPPYQRRLRDRIHDARDVSPSSYPSKRLPAKGPRLDIDEKRFDELRDYRNRIAQELEIEPTLIATRQTLESLSAYNLAEKERGAGLLSWQSALLAPVLRDAATA